MPELVKALETAPSVVLEAPPGAGKTTIVPLALKDEAWCSGRIVMLEPRRLAARAAARRMAASLGEEAGQTVGYVTRTESKRSAKTKIEVVTEGILTRRLLKDPELDGVSCIIFDEFHERNLQGDLGLALAVECQQALRDDLKILVMSATLDGDAIARHLGDAPRVTSEGRAFPVEARYKPLKEDRRDIGSALARTVPGILKETTGSLLCFLPGEREIHQAADMLDSLKPGRDVDIRPLYGALSIADQDAAIKPAPDGRRKVVLATDIAESSLTIEDIRVVVDAGYCRRPRYDAASDASILETRRISRASATQRQGRAGRVAPGICYRLWPEAEMAGLPAQDKPEIERAELLSLVLDMAAWGVTVRDGLPWLTLPPARMFDGAQGLLRQLGAVDDAGALTTHGQDMADMPVHPRLAHMMVSAPGEDKAAAALLAALCEEQDILQRQAADKSVDIDSRLQALADGGRGRDLRRGNLQRVRQLAGRFFRLQKTGDQDIADVARDARDQAGRLLALAWPDRIARRQGQQGDKLRYKMANGRAVELAAHDPVAGSEFLVVTAMGGAGTTARIFLAAPLDLADLFDLFPDADRFTPYIHWNSRKQLVDAVEAKHIGDIVLAERPLAKPDREMMTAAMVDGMRHMGASALPWNDDCRALQARLSFAAGQYTDWPGFDDGSLEQDVDTWLAPYLSGISSRKGLKALDLATILKSRLTWEQQQVLEKVAPERLSVPSGNSHRLDYQAEDGPVLAVKLQEMFGETESPVLGPARIPVKIHLLSPGGRPLAITRDLAFFWKEAYPGVKSEMKGRYPKHPWPDNPLDAMATAKTNRALARKKSPT